MAKPGQAFGAVSAAAPLADCPVRAAVGPRWHAQCSKVREVETFVALGPTVPPAFGQPWSDTMRRSLKVKLSLIGAVLAVGALADDIKANKGKADASFVEEAYVGSQAEVRLSQLALR